MGQPTEQPQLGGLLKLLCAASCGAMVFLATATFDIWPLAWIAFVPLLWAIAALSPRRAFFWGWLAGTVANAGGFYWIITLLMRFGQMNRPIATLLYVLLVAYQGLNWGLFAYLTRRIAQRRPTFPIELLVPLVFVGVELITPLIFDWYMAITQAWVLPVIQIAELFGPLGVSFMILLVNATLFRALWRWRRGEALRWRPLAITALTLAAVLAFGFVRIAQIDRRRAAAERVKVGIVQANIGIVDKGRMQLAAQHHRIHLEQSRELQQKGAELLVWPESSYPFAIRRGQTRDFPVGDVRRIMQGLSVPLLFGALSYSPREPYPYNTAYLMTPDGKIEGHFDKNFLLIFGEYIPFYDRLPSFRKWFPAASHFARGTEVTTFPFRGRKIAPLICYEDILPAFGRRLAPLKPQLMVNITNDAWFGATSEPYQHLALAVYRSIELRLDMVRAVNTGVSTLIEASGRLGPSTRSYDPVVMPDVKPVSLLVDAALIDTPATIYATLGDIPGYLCLAIALVFAFWPSATPRPGAKNQKKPRRR